VEHGFSIEAKPSDPPATMVMLRPYLSFVILQGLVLGIVGYNPSNTPSPRRILLADIAKLSIGTTSAASVWLNGGGLPMTTTTTGNNNVAHASGGATAGKYTTIPIAKRRYYGRVQQAVHEFLDMGPTVVKGDMTVATIQTFFDPLSVVVVPAKRKDVNGQCTKKDGDCRGKEVRDSRYNDMKASMYLLANAFRTDQQKPPDRLRKWVVVFVKT
jgi:hypothetical protein